VAIFRLIACTILTSGLFAAPSIFPLKDVRPGQRGIGKTIFSGDKIEEFQVEVLGVLENLGPKQSIILARLSGGPLEKTGVIQGMSGSPVYIDGKLAGAVALAFSFAKDPIAGIRPIEDMLAVEGAPLAGRVADLVSPNPAAAGKTGWLEASTASGLGDLVEIATPVSLSGFTPATIDHFAPELRKLHLEPRQGVSSGGSIPAKLGSPQALRAGDMISVQLLSGDLTMGADGTVTAIDDKHVFAFGHRFLAVGGTELPFARANVITVLANLSSSFKISSPLEWMGTITEDRSTSIYGELGRRAATVPLSISLQGSRPTPMSYHMEMVNDRVLSPLILQMAVFSAIDATERTTGLGSFVLHGAVDFQQGLPPLRLENTYSGDFNVPLIASLGVASPLSYIMGSGFDALKIKDIHLSIEAFERKRVLQIDQIAVSKKEIHPGDTVELAVTLAGENGVEVTKNVRYPVQIGCQPGTLQFTIADASTTNFTEYQQLIGIQPKSPSQVVSFLNGLRPNTNAYVRVWRMDPSFQVQGADLPDPPSSVALLLSKSQSTPTNLFLMHGSTLALLPIDAGSAVVNGSKTVQVEIKE
jgi:hypothetical protein